MIDKMRKLAGVGIGAGLGAIALMGGCQQRQPLPPDVVDQTPVAIDPAMQRRTWSQSVATYADSNIVAGPTGVLYEVQPDRPDWQYLPLDNGGFLGNTLLMPYTFVRTPPWSAVNFRGATVPPAHGAMPPLPPEEAPDAPPAPPAPPSEDIPAEPINAPSSS